MTVIILTKNNNNNGSIIDSPMDHLLRRSNSTAPLTVNSRSSFTLHFALWPYVGLLSLITCVWLFIYISMNCPRYTKQKAGRRRLSSACTTNDTVMPGGYEPSMIV